MNGKTIRKFGHPASAASIEISIRNIGRDSSKMQLIKSIKYHTFTRMWMAAAARRPIKHVRLLFASAFYCSMIFTLLTLVFSIFLIPYLYYQNTDDVDASDDSLIRWLDFFRLHSLIASINLPRTNDFKHRNILLIE